MSPTEPIYDFDRHAKTCRRPTDHSGNCSSIVPTPPDVDCITTPDGGCVGLNCMHDPVDDHGGR